jgi:hypothetical protein
VKQVSTVRRATRAPREAMPRRLSPTPNTSGSPVRRRAPPGVEPAVALVAQARSDRSRYSPALPKMRSWLRAIENGIVREYERHATWLARRA